MATLTFPPWTTTTRFSSGIGGWVAEITKIGCTYRNESSMGTISRSPNTTCDPSRFSSVICWETVGSCTRRLLTCAGPSTFSPLGNWNAVSLPYWPGSDPAAK